MLKSHAVASSLLAVALMAATPNVHADTDGSCTTAADVGSKVWKHAGPTVKTALKGAGPFGATAATAASFIEKGIKLWNKIAGDQTWAKIGPRRMDFGKWNDGTLIGKTERLFLSAIPAVNPVVVDFERLDMKGEAKVVICKVPEKGKAMVVKSFTTTEKSKNKTVKIDDAKGYVIAVALHGKLAVKSVKYRVRAKMTYDDKQVKAPEHVVTGDRTPDDNTKTGKRTPSKDNTKAAPRAPSKDKAKSAPHAAPQTPGAR